MNALSLAKTEKEKLYGKAVASFFEGKLNKSKGERLIAFDKNWQIAKKELPDDIEARLFSVLAMLVNCFTK